MYTVTEVIDLKFARLKDLREDKNLTQQQVSDLLGIQQTVYSRYERGAQDIPVRLRAQE